MNIVRKTLRAPLSFTGVGLHTGVPVTMTLHPSNDGIAFRLGGERTIAIAANVTDTTRSTKLGSVGTIEHLMSALCGLEITDVEVELDAPEVPGMDGSALPFVEAILVTGLEDIGEREMPGLFRRIFLQSDDIKVAVAKGSGHWRYVYATGDRWPHEQPFESLDVAAEYATEIAPARTFALAEEIPVIIQMGLGLGLDESSCLILGIEGYKNEPRMPNEPARHKLLDLLGDLYLSGVPARALSVVAERSGHRTNVEVAAQIAEAVRDVTTESPV